MHAYCFNSTSGIVGRLENLWNTYLMWLRDTLGNIVLSKARSNVIVYFRTLPWINITRDSQIFLWTGNKWDFSTRLIVRGSNEHYWKTSALVMAVKHPHEIIPYCVVLETYDRTNIFYSCRHHGGRNQISHAKTFWEFRPRRYRLRSSAGVAFKIWGR